MLTTGERLAALSNAESNWRKVGATCKRLRLNAMTTKLALSAAIRLWERVTRRWQWERRRADYACEDRSAQARFIQALQRDICNVEDARDAAIRERDRLRAALEVPITDMYWCRDCHRFVPDYNHRCEQWAEVYKIPAAALDAYRAALRARAEVAM